MMLKHILIRSVCLVLTSLSLVTATVAGAEQPIIIPVVLVISQAPNQVGPVGPPQLRIAVYKISAAQNKTLATISSHLEHARKKCIEGKEPTSDDGRVHRAEFSTLKSRYENMSKSQPIVLRIVIDGNVAAYDQICCSSKIPGNKRIRKQDSVVQAVDLLTGRSTTVGSEYIAEYEQMVRSARR